MECIKINDQSGDKYDEFGNFEIDDALLMSFLDDSQVDEYCDNEKLSSVMRSLEAEIDQRSSIHVDQSMVDNSSAASNWVNIDQPFDHHHHHHGHEMEGYDETSGTQDCNWMDMMIPSSHSYGVDGIYMDQCGGEEMDEGGILKFETHEMEYYFEHFNGAPFEDQDHGSYGSFWQESLPN